MRYHNITTADMLNGDGLRTVLWVSGCNHHCPQCQNPQTWDASCGLVFEQSALKELMASLSQDWCDGLTLSGGDPLYPDNRASINEICKCVKDKFPKKTIWCYTGYLWEEIKDLRLLRYIDVLVDGEFDVSKADVNYNWAGSTNQRVIDVQKSLMYDEVVLYANN